MAGEWWWPDCASHHHLLPVQPYPFELAGDGTWRRGRLVRSNLRAQEGHVLAGGGRGSTSRCEGDGQGNVKRVLLALRFALVAKGAGHGDLTGLLDGLLY